MTISASGTARILPFPKATDISFTKGSKGEIATNKLKDKLENKPEDKLKDKLENKLTDKLKDNKGISLTELLSAIIVMLLVAAILTVGVKMGAKAYSESVSASEAQVLCSTLTNIIADELRYAGTTTVEADGSVKFFSQNFGSENEEGLSFGTNEEGQMILGTNRVLSKGAYPYGLNTKTRITYSEDSGIFGVELRVYGAGGTELAANSFDVRRINRR